MIMNNIENSIENKEENITMSDEINMEMSIGSEER
jgi:hypothetical protein